MSEVEYLISFTASGLESIQTTSCDFSASAFAFSSWLFLSVELGATQKSPSRFPTKVFTPLQVAAPAQCSYSTPVSFQQSPPVEDNDGVERISLANLAEFPSSGPLLVPDSMDEDEDIPT